METAGGVSVKLVDAINKALAYYYGKPFDK